MKRSSLRPLSRRSVSLNGVCVIQLSLSSAVRLQCNACICRTRDECDSDVTDSGESIFCGIILFIQLF